MNIIAPLSEIPPDLWEFFEPADAPTNQSSVLRLGPEPLSDAHYAAFPSEIPRRCILAGTSAKGCCPACGASWVRVIETRFKPTQDPQYTKDGNKGFDDLCSWNGVPRGINETTTTGWRPSCPCPEAPPVPSTVLDPFTGSGTTALVARNLGRDFVGCDISEEYVAMARRRLKDEQPLFT